MWNFKIVLYKLQNSMQNLNLNKLNLVKKYPL